MDIQINSSGLWRYQKRLGINLLFTSFVISVIFGFIVMFSLMFAPKIKASFFESIWFGFWTFLSVLFVLSLISILYSYYTNWRFAREYAGSLSVMVSGSYLRIIEHGYLYSDRKIHFNQLTWYSIMQDSSMKSAGIKALLIGTRNAHLPIKILGIESIEEVRDFLVDYDSKHKHLA